MMRSDQGDNFRVAKILKFGRMRQSVVCSTVGDEPERQLADAAVDAPGAVPEGQRAVGLLIVEFDF